MVRLRTKGLESLPPPPYHPDSTSVTVAIYYGGQIEVSKYVEGKVRKFDYVDLETLQLGNLEEFVQDLVKTGEFARFYTGVPGGFKLLLNDDELRQYGQKYLKKKLEYFIILDLLPLNNDDELSEDDTHENIDDVVPENNENIADVDNGKSNKMPERESSIEFCARAEDTEEWISEYNRRYPGPSSNIDACDVNTDESDVDYNSGQIEISSDDESLFENTVSKDVEPFYVVESGEDVNGEPVVFMNFDVVPNSSDDEDFVGHVDVDTSLDDILFDDNVSIGAEFAQHETETDDSESHASSYMQNVVGSEEEELDMDRVSADENEVNSLPTYNNLDVFDPTFYLGQPFLNKSTFKKAVTSYAIKTRRSLPFTKSCQERCYVRCAEKECPFKLNAMRVPGEKHAYVLREINLDHNCTESYHVANVKTPWLAAKYVADFKSDPKRNVQGWRTDVQKKLSVNVSTSQAYRAKRKALDILNGDPDFQYTKLWDYCNELRKTNAGSTIILGTDDTDGEPRFSKFYACFKAMKVGFKSCRPILGVDGCHLKGPHGGVLLTAVGFDPNNNFFPVAYAVVSIENKENWSWFFSVLKTDLEMGNGEGFTFMSDKQKGLIHALPEVFPASEIRFCVRHLILNLNAAGHRGLDLTNSVWKAAKSNTIGEFRVAMRQMRDNHPAAYEWFKDKHPSQWSKSHFLEHSKCDVLLNNCCESFNSSILPARKEPIITMLEWMREYLMKYLQKCREESDKWEGLLCPKIEAVILEHGKKVGGCRPIKASRSDFQVQSMDGGQYAVSLDDRTCSCRRWQLTGIPCRHALSALYEEKKDGLDMVDECYTVETYKQVYSGVIIPISSQEIWGETMFVPPIPPNFGRKAGRPTKLRRRGIDEADCKGKKKAKKNGTQKLRRFQTTIHCGICHGAGHNALFCPQLPESAQTKRQKLFDNARKSAEKEAGPSGVAKESEPDHIDLVEDITEMGPQLLPPHTQSHITDDEIDETLGYNTEMYTYDDVPNSAGPSMFEQLGMGNQGMSGRPRKRELQTIKDIQASMLTELSRKKEKATKQKGVKLRVPPTLTENDLIMSQSSVCGPMPEKIIIIDGKKKFLDLSGPSTPASQ